MNEFANPGAEGPARPHIRLQIHRQDCCDEGAEGPDIMQDWGDEGAEGPHSCQILRICCEIMARRAQNPITSS